MDARLLAAGTGIVALGGLGLGALVLTRGDEALVVRHDSPVLIAAVEPNPQPPPPPAPAPAPAVVAALPPTAPDLPPAVPSAPMAASPVMPKPPTPQKPKPPIVNHRYDGVLTVAEISKIRSALRLSPDQEPYWPSVASVLREVGRRQMEQVDAGQKPSFDLPNDLSSRLYSAVMPLLGTLREDQKEVVRRRAKTLGLDSVASFI